MKRLHFTARAERDVDEIVQFGLTEFGASAALRYIESLDARLERLVRHPELGVQRPDLPGSLRSFPSDSHIIYYRLSAEGILVHRILHGSSDPLRHL